MSLDSGLLPDATHDGASPGCVETGALGAYNAPNVSVVTGVSTVHGADAKVVPGASVVTKESLYRRPECAWSGRGVEAALDHLYYFAETKVPTEMVCSPKVKRSRAAP